MNRLLSLLVILLSACASPRYTYVFDRYNVTSGPDAALSAPGKAGDQPGIESRYLSANAESVPDLFPSHREQRQQSHDNVKSQNTTNAKEGQGKFSRKEIKLAIKQVRKELHALKGDSKYASKSPLNDQATQKLDKEVIVAIAFGAVGITLSLLGGISAAFWIAGVLCLGVGVYFFVDWLSKR